jgi:hypothetical protein
MTNTLPPSIGSHLRDAITRRIRLALLMRRFHDTVDGTLDGVVAPPRQQVACIDNDGAFDRRRVYKLSRRALNLQSAPVVLEQERDGAVVLCRSC